MLSATFSLFPLLPTMKSNGGLYAANATTQMEAFENLCKLFDIEEMSLDSWIEAAKIWAVLRKKGTPIGKDDGDIMIAAHCIANGYTVVTDNVDDFSRIDGVKFINWKD